MVTDYTFRCLVQQLRTGDRQAAAAVVERFGNRLKGLANRRLDPRVRAKVDPEDVAQAVFEDFFRRCAAGEFTIESWESAWAVLSVVAVRRCAWEGRWYTAARRDVRREVPDVRPAADADSMDSLPGPDESPDQDVLLAETFEHVMDQLTVADHVVVQLAMEGRTVSEISEAVGRTTRSVYRVLQCVRELLSAQPAEPAEAH